ncbi:MAG: T9SS type A sorting domain-containing protein [Bacteroidetes bacterium]|nr:T9SS type A sorting domain-containing protein [Bacteroidota bacterium]
MKLSSLFVIVMFIGISVYAQQVPKFNSSNIITLTVTFDVPPTNITVGKSALRYNKAFAYSFILDDGLIDAYTAAFPLLNGGLVTGNDTIYPGYFYSDGCGNAIPFSAGLSWYSVNSAGTDLHVNTPGYVTWDQLTTMYNAGWNVLNHSYSHAANDTAIDYVYQVTQNTSYVKSKCGIDLSHFVPPAGDQNYVIPAFANGMLSVTGNNGAYNGSPDGYPVDQPIDFSNFTLYKMLVSDANQNTANIMQKIDTVASRSVNGAHFWWSDFTHHVGFQSSGASLLFPLFRFYMENIAQQYGITGSDNVWMSPTQDVYEYLRVRDNSLVNYSLSGNVLTITVDYSAAPAKMRTNALTLVIQADQNFSNVAATGLQEMTFNGTGNNKLINLQWGDSPISVNEIASGKQTNACNISVYPNPFINKLCIDFSEAVNGEINFELINIAGKTIITKTVIQPKGESHFELNLNEINLQPGIYFLKSVNGQKPFPTVKVIKIQK